MWAASAELAGGAARATDGVSIAPTLLGGHVREQEALCWKFHTNCAEESRWKAMRAKAKSNPSAPIELFALSVDPTDSHDIFARRPMSSAASTT